MDRKGIYMVFLPITGIKPRALHTPSQFEQWVTSPSPQMYKLFFLGGSHVSHAGLELSMQFRMIFNSDFPASWNCRHVLPCPVLFGVGYQIQGFQHLRQAFYQQSYMLSECFHICSGFRLLKYKNLQKCATKFTPGDYCSEDFGMSLEWHGFLAAENVNNIIYDADFNHLISVLPLGYSGMEERWLSSKEHLVLPGSVPSTHMESHYRL